MKTKINSIPTLMSFASKKECNIQLLASFLEQGGVENFLKGYIDVYGKNRKKKETVKLTEYFAEMLGIDEETLIEMIK